MSLIDINLLVKKVSDANIANFILSVKNSIPLLLRTDGDTTRGQLHKSKCLIEIFDWNFLIAEQSSCV